MNQELEEKAIRELYRQLRRDDEPSAPPFAVSLKAALSKSDHARLAQVNQPQRPAEAVQNSLSSSTCGAFCGWMFQSGLLRFSHERADRFRFVRPAAVAMVTLLLLGGAWLVFSKRSTKTQSPVDVGISETPAPNVKSPPAPEPTPPSIAHQAMTSNGHRRKLVQPQPATMLVSEWHSPTVSLLRTPGEQLLKTVPRLDESLIEIRPLAPNRQKDQQN